MEYYALLAEKFNINPAELDDEGIETAVMKAIAIELDIAIERQEDSDISKSILGSFGKNVLFVENGIVKDIDDIASNVPAAPEPLVLVGGGLPPQWI